MNGQIPTTKRRGILAAAPLFLAGCASRSATSDSMDETNETTADSEYKGVDRPEPSGTNQTESDVMDEDVAAIATADDPAATADERGSTTAPGGLIVVAHLDTEEASESDAPEEFSRVIVTVDERIEGVVPFGQLTELAADEQVTRLSTPKIAVQEGDA